MNLIETLHNKGHKALQNNDFLSAATYFEQLIEEEPEVPEHHLSLGISYLLAGQEEAAQLTWAIAFSKADEDQEDNLYADLIRLLQAKIHDLKNQHNWNLVDLLYRHLHEINPLDVAVILQGIQAALHIQEIDRDMLANTGLMEALSNSHEQSIPIDTGLIEDTLEQILTGDSGDPDILPWIESVSHYLSNLEKITYALNKKAVQFRQRDLRSQSLDIALAYVKSGLRLNPKHFGLKHEQIMVHIKGREYEKVIALAKELYQECQTIRTRIRVKGLLLEGLFHTPELWEEGRQELDELLNLLDQFLNEYTEDSNFEITPSFLLRNLFYFQYIQDNPQVCRAWQNRISTFYLKALRSESSLKSAVQSLPQFSHQRHQGTQKEKLRVGFLSEFMDQHSIGWLSRWFFQQYDSDRLEIYVYFHSHEMPVNGLSPFSETWFAQRATRSFTVFGTAQETAQKIYDDEIDVLVDLDSVTSERTYAVMALKPAPVQVTWLGYDATGLPTIDYFLVDPLVLPDGADAYYTEALWRLPNTYIAVSGFEVGVPTLRRETLDIPADAVVYFSAQTAVKRHPETVHCQLQILKQVPNSYLLLKGVGDSASLQNALLQSAEMEGISGDRFRFLQLDMDEMTHRANLSIADVVLDTFPYTGATTTLETLWMGIPLVTRVGQQFASRNSYAMLRHTGIQAGIAHSAQEYIEWGVRFGKDAALREEVQSQLWRSRQTSPLWNAEQFARDMENAFEQMWQKYIDS